MKCLFVAALGAALLSTPAAADSGERKNVVFDAKPCNELEDEASALEAMRFAYLSKAHDLLKKNDLDAHRRRVDSANEFLITLSRLASVYNAFCKP